jgi:DNA-directed RNA polymerase subunit RPC12/RpoP
MFCYSRAETLNDHLFCFREINIIMVVFHCGDCGEALKKNQVDKHLISSCRRAQTLSCIDCGKDFK